LDGNLLNVRDFGATGDGTTDDSAAILATVAALPMYTFPHKLITQIMRVLGTRTPPRTTGHPRDPAWYTEQ
jgi:hypothetical protein